MSSTASYCVKAGERPATVRPIGRPCPSCFASALRHAVQWGIVPQNVADNVSPPRVEPTEIEILREGDVKGLLDKLRGRSLYMIAVQDSETGMRRGEMLALRWQDIDFTTGKVRIERSLEQTKAGGLRFKTPKTNTGRRTISNSSSVAAELRAHLTSESAGSPSVSARLAMTSSSSPHGTANHGPRMRCQRTGRRQWRAWA